MNPDNPAVILFFFPLVWAGVSFVIAQVGGWAELSRYYRSTGPFQGEKWYMRSCRMRLTTRYDCCVTVGANPDALFLSTVFLFRLGHPPLQIPWRDISVTNGKTMFWSWTEFRFQHAPTVWVRFYGRLGGDIRDNAGASWPAAAGAL